MTAIGRTFLSSPCGAIADHVNWPAYFAISMLVALPGMLLLVFLMRSEQGKVISGEKVEELLKN